MAENVTKIVLVGAGISGFSAASKLMELGYSNIVILEAENRIGGRINSVPFHKGFIDLGAQWVHGKGKHVIYEMCNKSFDFGDAGFDGVDSIFQLSKGEKANQGHCRKLARLSESILSSDLIDKSNGSLGDFFTEQWKKNLATKKYSDIPTETCHQMLDFSHRGINELYGTPTWFAISTAMDATQEDATGNHFVTWKTHGFKTVFDYLTVSFFNVESKASLTMLLKF